MAKKKNKVKAKKFEREAPKEDQAEAIAMEMEAIVKWKPRGVTQATKEHTERLIIQMQRQLGMMAIECEDLGFLSTLATSFQNLADIYHRVNVAPVRNKNKVQARDEEDSNT